MGVLKMRKLLIAILYIPLLIYAAIGYVALSEECRYSRPLANNAELKRDKAIGDAMSCIRQDWYTQPSSSISEFVEDAVAQLYDAGCLKTGNVTTPSLGQSLDLDQNEEMTCIKFECIDFNNGGNVYERRSACRWSWQQV